MCLSCGSHATVAWARATDLEYFTTSSSYSYYQCEKCRALSISPVPTESLASIYPPNYYAFDLATHSPLQRVKQWLDQRRLRKLLAKIPGSTLSVLDVGGGTGWMLELMKASDARVQETTVVDTSEAAVQKAKQAGHLGHAGTLESFATEKKYDLILLLNLIEHVENPAALLEKAKSLLSKKGLILIKTPNADCWEGRLLRHKNWGAYHCPRHWVLFTPESLKQILTRSHLQTLNLQCTQGATFWASTLLMQAHQRGWVRLGPERPIDQHPLHGVLCGIFAAVDSFRALFSRTSQMFLVASHSND